jgi:hypothetical protein
MTLSPNSERFIRAFPAFWLLDLSVAASLCTRVSYVCISESRNDERGRGNNDKCDGTLPRAESSRNFGTRLHPMQIS